MKNMMELAPNEAAGLIKTLKARFEKNMVRHKDLVWSMVQEQLEAHPRKLWSLHEMDLTGGEPDVISLDKKTGEFIFCDCSPETPKGRRSVCYDRAALDSRKEHKPANSALDLASEMGIDVLDETEYRALQQLGQFDMKTSSWIRTPDDIRELGGALFADRRYGKVFVYHNGASSYYAVRGFRGILCV
ncbi:MAG TPA: DUF4256 domain-containing protein [Flavobacteriales bacterium]|nr:DUF4256 domain-containing protein [Flavobacteriales bacterium]